MQALRTGALALSMLLVAVAGCGSDDGTDEELRDSTSSDYYVKIYVQKAVNGGKYEKVPNAIVEVYWDGDLIESMLTNSDGFSEQVIKDKAAYDAQKQDCLEDATDDSEVRYCNQAYEDWFASAKEKSLQFKIDDRYTFTAYSDSLTGSVTVDRTGVKNGDVVKITIK